MDHPALARCLLLVAFLPRGLSRLPTKRSLRVGSLDAAEVSIHLLGTAKHQKFKDPPKPKKDEPKKKPTNPKTHVPNSWIPRQPSGRPPRPNVPKHRRFLQEDYYDYFEHRMWASVSTWGRDFVRLTFVLGGGGEEERDLVRHGHSTVIDGEETFIECRPQNLTKLEQARGIEYSECDGGFRVLLATRCTNAYYGADGPCCRNQESMRWALKYEPEIKWYAFMDDDMFIRGPALLGLLSSLNPRMEVAIGANVGMRGFAPGMWRELAEQGCDSANLCVFAFPWMQPAFFSKAALDKMEPSIDENGLTAECRAFKVTHDVGLGIFNWMHQIPTISLPKIFAAHADNLSPNRRRTGPGIQDYVTIHAVRRRNGDHTIGNLGGVSGKDGPQLSFEAVDLAYQQLENETNGLNKSFDAGYKAARLSRVQPVNGFNSTLKGRIQEAQLYGLLPRDYSNFSTFYPHDCKSVDFLHAKKFCRSKPDVPGIVKRGVATNLWHNISGMDLATLSDDHDLPSSVHMHHKHPVNSVGFHHPISNDASNGQDHRHPGRRRLTETEIFQDAIFLVVGG